MAQIISLNIVRKSLDGGAIVNNSFPGTKNAVVYNPAVVRGFDTMDIISPIRANGLGSYFIVQEWKGMDIESRKDSQITFVSSDSLAAITALSSNFVLLTVTKRDAIRKVNMGNEQMIFDINKIMSALEPVPAPGVGTIFNYIEGGNPNPMQYTVQETIAQIAAASAIVVPPSLIYDEVPAGVQDGVNTDFTLANIPLGLQLVQNGSVIKPGVDYTLVGNTITFVVAPDPADSLLAFYLK